MSTTSPLPGILLADPDESLCISARRVFERRGFQVTIASDGEQALALFDPEFHIVILSVTLPKRDGLAVMRQIRSRAPETQIVLLTDAGSVSSAMMGLKEGAFQYILKPIADYLQLTHAVERALELYTLRRRAPDTIAMAPASPPAPASTSALAPAEQSARELRRWVETFRQPQPQILQDVVQSVANILGTHRAIIFLMRDSQPLVPVASLGDSDLNAAAAEFANEVGEEFARRVANERKTLMNFDSRKKQFHIGTPLTAHDQVIGVLIAYPLPEGAGNPERLAWFEAYAALTAAAIELARLNDENSRLSPTDPLTKTLRDGFFLEIAEREFRRSWRFNETLSVIHVVIDDLDALKTRSRELSDRALRSIADVCRQSIRNIDLVSRGPDDTFTLLLLMTDSAGVQTVADRILRAVQSISFQDAGQVVSLSIKMGVTTYPHEGCTSILDLFEIVRSAHSKLRADGKRIVRV
jgi:diguanylate cyclase (GGDEF)-like protein